MKWKRNVLEKLKLFSAKIKLDRIETFIMFENIKQALVTPVWPKTSKHSPYLSLVEKQITCPSTSRTTRLSWSYDLNMAATEKYKRVNDHVTTSHNISFMVMISALKQWLTSSRPEDGCARTAPSHETRPCRGGANELHLFSAGKGADQSRTHTSPYGCPRSSV